MDYSIYLNICLTANFLFGIRDELTDTLHLGEIMTVHISQTQNTNTTKIISLR